jgi:putative chitinase
MVTPEILIAVDSRSTLNATKVAAALNIACREFNITDPAEVAALIGVCTVETGGWNVLAENLNYSTAAQLVKIFPSRFANEAAATPYLHAPEKLANHVYANRNGNGDEATGDGWRYRGRGYIQITGRRNYAACMLALYGRSDADPDLLLTPEGAARSAAWFWVTTHCGQALRTSGMDAVTRIVNGPGMAGAANRAAYYAKARRLLEAAT